MIRQNQKNSGFTLIEVMISASLLMIALLGANAQFFQQIKMEGAVNAQLASRLVLNQITSKLRASIGDFPPYFNLSGDPISYIGCFSIRGEQVANKSPHNSLGYFGEYLTDLDQATDYCPDADIEAHITHTFANEPYRIRVDLIVLPSKGVRIYTLARDKYQTEFNFIQSL